MDPIILLSICVAGAVGAAGYFVATTLLGNKDGKIRSRLEKKAPIDGKAEVAMEKKATITPVLQKIGSAAAQPFMPKKRETQSSIRKQLGFAGIYSHNAVRVMTGAKVILLFGGLLTGYILGTVTQSLFLWLPIGGLLGYLAPTIWLKMKVSENQKALTYGLPDALDLMVVCVEAGLTVDAAMQRVGDELKIAHPALSRELGIAHMETRVGLSKQESFKNLATRTNNKALSSLTSMLIQADRFGTSIATALRVHSDSLRTVRQQQAEEAAAKASVKMSFPLVLFIFPATFIVLCGPTVVNLMDSPIMK
jgi:tight adherence protein C